jgi:hypothetical protein
LAIDDLKNIISTEIKRIEPVFYDRSMDLLGLLIFY